MSARYEPFYLNQSAYNLGIANTNTSYHIQNWDTYPSAAATITNVTIANAINEIRRSYTAGSLTLASPKPESDLDWLRRRVKEVCWVLPAKR